MCQIFWSISTCISLQLFVALLAHVWHALLIYQTREPQCGARLVSLQAGVVGGCDGLVGT